MENNSRKEFYSIKYSPQTWKHNYMVQIDPYGRKKKNPSLYISQWPYRIIIYMAEYLNHFLITLTKKGLLSNISTKMQNFQPKASSTAQQTVLFYKIHFRQVLTTLNSSGEDTLH